MKINLEKIDIVIGFMTNGLKFKNKVSEERRICLGGYIQIITYSNKVKSKVGDKSRGQPEGSLFNSYYTKE